VRWRADWRIKFAEVDTYHEGRDPKTRCAVSGRESFSADSVADLVTEVMRFCGTEDRDNVQLDACEEPGRIDVQVMETDAGEPADARDLEAWKAGKLQLWAATYIFHAERCQTVKLELALRAEKADA
jgi:hypothetical protein